MNIKIIATIVNLSHLTGISLPIVVFFATESTGVIEPLICSSMVLLISLVSGFLWEKSIRSRGYFENDISIEKDLALKAACETCFSILWFIPNKVLISISDAKWSLDIKSRQPTVRSAMIASLDGLYLIIGGIVLAGIYMAFIGDFGISLTRISNLIGGGRPIQIVLIFVSPWVSLVYLFNWFFRKFLTKV
jgi:hypothetical protein